MTHIDAMKQGLEALEEAVHYTSAPVWSPSMTKECNEAITSLRQAIAEAEAVKVEYAYTCVGCDYLSWANNFSCDCQVPSHMKFNRVKVIR